MAEVGHLKMFGADLGGQRFDLLMRKLQEPVEEPQFIHELERRGMNRVAAEIAEEIRVLLQHNDMNSRPREQESEHHASGAAAGDAARGRDC